MEFTNYWYSARVEKVVDGDTVDLVVDLGFRTSMRDRFRLYGINAWETRGDDREKGLAAKARLEGLIGGREITINTYKDERGKYGRWLAILYVDEININGLLVQEGHAVTAKY